MVRTIVTPENTHIELDIPVDYVGRKVEITFFADRQNIIPRQKRDGWFLGNIIWTKQLGATQPYH